MWWPLRKVHVGVHEPGQPQPRPELNHVLTGVVTTKHRRISTRSDHPVDDQQRVAATQPATVEGVRRGVEERADEQRHRHTGDDDNRDWAAARSWNASSNHAATPTAITAGSLPVSVGRPIGVVTRSSADSG